MSSKPKDKAKSNSKSEPSKETKKSGKETPKYASLEEEIKALRKGLNFSPDFEPTAPAPYPPPAFTNDLSFGDGENAEARAASGRIKLQSLDNIRLNSASSVNDILNGLSLSPAKLSNSDSSVPRFGFQSSDPFDVLDSPKNKPSPFPPKQRGLGSKGRLDSGSLNKLGTIKEVSRTSSQLTLSTEKQNIPHNLSTLGYSLLGVPRNKIPSDVLDEFVKQERLRERDYFTLLKERFEE